jgi:RNA polymerase sigma-70 factor (ECF subfamily)
MNIEEIYDRLGRKVYGYLIMKLGSTCDAEDVCQEVFCRLARYSVRRRFVRNQAAFVFKTARREADRFLERKIRDRKGSQEARSIQVAIQNSLSGPSPEEEELAAMALARVPEDQREIIVLKVFEGLTFKEIASICRVPPNTAASRFRYGMEKLRSILEREHAKDR